MRVATEERMISIMALVMVISIGFAVPKAAAQAAEYSKMALNVYTVLNFENDRLLQSRLGVSAKLSEVQSLA
jgi:hypothetical protein